MRKLATVLALSLAATHGLPTPRGSAIAKKDEAKDDAPRFLRGGISKDGDEAVNPGRKPLMGSMVPPVPPFVGIVTPPRGTLPISKSCEVPDVEYSNPSIREELNTIQMPECADAIEFWGTIPANDENGLVIQNMKNGDEIVIYSITGVASFKEESHSVLAGILGIVGGIADENKIPRAVPPSR